MVNWQKIKVADAKEMLDNKQAMLIDIRASEDYKAEHDDVALNLTQDIVDKFITSTPKEMPLLMLCYHGISSQSAANYFSEQGFTEVYSIEGGYEEWKKHK